MLRNALRACLLALFPIQMLASEANLKMPEGFAASNEARILYLGFVVVLLGMLFGYWQFRKVRGPEPHHQVHHPFRCIGHGNCHQPQLPDHRTLDRCRVRRHRPLLRLPFFLQDDHKVRKSPTPYFSETACLQRLEARRFMM